VNSALVVFLKAPVAGKVKTRLAENIGKEAALKAYRLVAEHVVDSVRKQGVREGKQQYDTILFVDEDEGRNDVIEWLGGEVRVQQGNDLGERLLNSFKECFTAYKHVVIIGSDAPFVGPLIDDAFKALKSHSLVIGPAFDGGYYLIGLARSASRWREVFADVAWSKSSVFNDTLENAQEAGIEAHLLSEMHDMDTLSDMRAIERAYPDEVLTSQLIALRQG